MNGLRRAIVLLTRIPLGTQTTPPSLDGIAAWFPVVGVIVGLVVAGAYVVLYPWMPSLLAAVVAILVGILVTGAFHEDGLADTFDSLGAEGDREEALAIMRDSRLGTYGIVALVGSILLRVVTLGSMEPWLALAALAAAHALARSAPVVLMATTSPARSEGLGLSGVAGADTAGAIVAVAIGVSVTALALGWWTLAAVLLVALATLVIRRLALRKVGGITGDMLGAGEQLGEISVMVVAAVAGWQGWMPWWAG
ncbi:MAG TPA: adenosylcobinamide-GDP ribazoletransferase [Acidimicrobiia bacterium]|nr:adenosylcobinamide-GDP ribazoletransferase [Acidimicrobiia bacterium]